MKNIKNNNPMYPFYSSLKVDDSGYIRTYWRRKCSKCGSDGWWQQPKGVTVTRELIAAGFRIRNWAMDANGSGACNRCRGLANVYIPTAQMQPDYLPKLLAIRDGIIAEGAQASKARPLTAAPISTVYPFTPPAFQMPLVDTPPATIPAPSRGHRRDILNVLDRVYDLEAQKYSGTWTDASVAREVGEDTLPEWVAEERERAYGPAGDINNPESLAELQRLMQACTDAGAAAMEAAVAAEAAVAVLKKKLELEG